MQEHFVAAETRRPYLWFYSPDIKTYIQKDKNGEFVAGIKGRNLPDPNMITDKLQQAIRNGDSTYLGRRSADPVTYKLWKHWMEVKDA